MIPFSFVLLFLFFSCLLSFNVIVTPPLSVGVLSYRFGNKLNSISSLSVSGITVMPVNSISTPSAASTNTVLPSNSTKGRDHIQQGMEKPLVSHKENKTPNPPASSTTKSSSTAKSTSPPMNPASNSDVANAASKNPSSAQPKPTSPASNHSPTSTTGSAPSSSLNLVRKWDEECGGLSYSDSFACYDKHYHNYYKFKDSSLWDAKLHFNSLIDTNPTPFTEPCQSSNQISLSFIDFESFYTRHYSQLTKNCSDTHQYSHCQVYSLIDFNPYKKTCSCWHRQPCLYPHSSFIFRYS